MGVFRFVGRLFVGILIERVVMRIVRIILPLLIIAVLVIAGSGQVQASTGGVTPIPVAWGDLKQYSFSKVGPGTLIYNAPNGSVVGGFPEGFSFVPLVKKQNGFGQMMDGRWVELSALTGELASPFVGLSIPGALPAQIGWVLLYTQPSSAPGSADKVPHTALHRYDRVTIMATQHVGQWDWYEVAPGQWIEQRRVARIVPAPHPAGATNKWVSVNIYEQILTAYEGNNMVFATMVATGLSPAWSTHIGTFNVWHRQTSTKMYGDMGGPDFYNLPYVPYVMFFDKNISLHGTYWHDGFGYEHSHGCVNMSISDAKWIFNWSADTPTMTVDVIAGP